MLYGLLYSTQHIKKNTVVLCALHVKKNQFYITENTLKFAKCK